MDSPSTCSSEAGAGASASCCVHHESKSALDSAITNSAMCACCAPQYSVHCPRKVPLWVASSQAMLVCPGITSVFPPPLVCADFDCKGGTFWSARNGGEREHRPHHEGEQHQGRQTGTDINPPQPTARTRNRDVRQ